MIRAAAIAVMLIALSGCDMGEPVGESKIGGLRVRHDDVRNVTCWSIGSNTLSCIPDWMLSQQKADLK